MPFQQAKWKVLHNKNEIYKKYKIWVLTGTPVGHITYPWRREHVVGETSYSYSIHMLRGDFVESRPKDNKGAVNGTADCEAGTVRWLTVKTLLHTAESFLRS